MKKVHLFISPLFMYLTELPLVVLLIAAIIFNDNAAGIVKLYPLIIVVSAAIIYIIVFLFRMVVISTDEIRAIGLYSSRDKAIINKGKTLILTLKESGRLIVTLFGNDGERPALDWASKEDYVPMDINLFKERVEGRARSCKRILNYFNVPKEDISDIMSLDSFEKEYDGISVRAESGEARTIYIKFNETL